MITDLVLASAHHVLAFTLVAILAIEIALVRPGLAAADLPLLSRVDALYGAVAVALVLVGVGRVMFGLRGWEYYVGYPIFWAKMAAFALVAVLSVPPTIRILRWRGAARRGMVTVPDAEIRILRTYLKAQAVVFVAIPILAAAMARGFYV